MPIKMYPKWWMWFTMLAFPEKWPDFVLSQLSRAKAGVMKIIKKLVLN
jgi:hypothetical protein